MINKRNAKKVYVKFHEEADKNPALEDEGKALLGYRRR